MANTFLCHDETDLNVAAEAVIAGVMNDSGGTNVLRVRRFGVINMDDGSGSGGLVRLVLRMYTATVTWTPGTGADEHTMDTAYSAPARLVSGFGGTPSTTGDIYDVRACLWDSTPATYNLGTAAEWETFIPFGVIFDGGYHDTACQPLVLRQDQACFLFNQAQVDNSIQWYAEVTDEAS
jgi:hypothetical protein